VLTPNLLNCQRAIDEARRRITLHLRPYFSGRRMVPVTTADLLAYIDHRETGIAAARGQRKGEGIGNVSNAEINRELTLLKRMFTLAARI
jgi:hypothetical protein